MKNIGSLLNRLGILIGVLLIISCSEDTIDITGLGAVKGTVVRKGTNEPLENVKLSTNPVTSTVFTDEEGVYIIENMPIGEYTLSAQKEGLLAEFESVSVIADKEIEVVFEMDVETAGNRPPDAPTLIAPADNAINQPVEVVLSWEATDPDQDQLTYAIQLRNDADSEVEVYEDIDATTFTLSGLQYGVKYFWQVIAMDDINAPVNSTTYAFTTQNAPNNRVLYTRLIGDNNVVYSSDENGDSEIQLTSENQNSFRPRRNPSTDKIAFLRTVGSQTHLFVMNEDGSQQQQVTSEISVSGFNFEEIDFAWDANGAKLLFPNLDKLYSIQIDGGGLELVYQTTNGSLITEVAKNELTGLIALKTNNLEGYEVEIFTIDVSGSIQDTVLTGVQGAAGGIDLSLDGTKLLYTYDVSQFESPSYRRLDSRVFLYDLNTAIAIDISEEKVSGTNDLDPRFSPNEAGVIYMNTSNDQSSVQNVSRMQIDGLNRVIVVPNASMPDWE